MEHRNSFQLLLSFTLVSILYFRAHALSTLGTYSAMRLGNRLPFDGPSEPDQITGSLKSDTDILQSTLPKNDKLYVDVNRALSRTARHTDGIFTSNYSKFLGELAARKYLESLIGKRGSNSFNEEQMPDKRHADAIFTENYSRLRKQMAVKKYINSVLNGKRSEEEIKTANLPEEADPAFSENYDDVTVDDLLSHLPLNI
uniref:VIP peptides n=1 Tax=Geotrypetes seraphini TaxID=260995 RepID=A0A6P8QGG5_GEOSA|nr:VIP peptides [Geotrypetes seraphini]XP_033794901.1 VIP peptides [Geotrypetes seraphini]